MLQEGVRVFREVDFSLFCHKLADFKEVGSLAVVADVK